MVVSRVIIIYKNQKQAHTHTRTNQNKSQKPTTKPPQGVFDCIYTRMGAKDCMGEGKSTFLVELGETGWRLLGLLGRVNRGIRAIGFIGLN